MKLETCFPLRLKWEDCDDDPGRNEQRTTCVNRGRSFKVGKHCNDWLEACQYGAIESQGSK
jgi:hypothetical protein